MATTTRYAPEVRERAIRLVQEHGQEYGSQWELRRANEILRKASAFFAQAELDRRVR
jgi:transposase-like protein